MLWWLFCGFFIALCVRVCGYCLGLIYRLYVCASGKFRDGPVKGSFRELRDMSFLDLIKCPFRAVWTFMTAGYYKQVSVAHQVRVSVSDTVPLAPEYKEGGTGFREEMANPLRPFEPLAVLPSCVVSVLDSTGILVGMGALVHNPMHSQGGERFVLLTAEHVVIAATQADGMMKLTRDGKFTKEFVPEMDWKVKGLDQIAVKIPDNVLSVLQVSPGKCARVNLNAPVHVITPPAQLNGPFRVSKSMARCAMAFKLRYTASTDRGSSGSPLLQGGNVVGVHLAGEELPGGSIVNHGAANFFAPVSVKFPVLETSSTCVSSVASYASAGSWTDKRHHIADCIYEFFGCNGRSKVMHIYGLTVYEIDTLGESDDGELVEGDDMHEVLSRISSRKLSNALPFAREESAKRPKVTSLIGDLNLVRAGLRSVLENPKSELQCLPPWSSLTPLTRQYVSLLRETIQSMEPDARGSVVNTAPAKKLRGSALPVVPPIPLPKNEAPQEDFCEPPMEQDSCVASEVVEVTQEQSCEPNLQLEGRTTAVGGTDRRGRGEVAASPEQAMLELLRLTPDLPRSLNAMQTRLWVHRRTNCPRSFSTFWQTPAGERFLASQDASAILLSLGTTAPMPCEDTSSQALAPSPPAPKPSGKKKKAKGTQATSS